MCSVSVGGGTRSSAIPAVEAGCLRVLCGNGGTWCLTTFIHSIQFSQNLILHSQNRRFALTVLMLSWAQDGEERTWSGIALVQFVQD